MAIQFGLGPSIDPRAQANPNTVETDEIVNRSLRLFEELRGDVSHDAERVSEELIEQLLSPTRSFSFAPLRRLPMHMADVEDNLDKLKGQVRYLQQEGSTNMPCVPVGDVLIPLSTEEVWRQRHDRDHESGYNGPMELAKSISIDCALSNVERHLSPFLADRMAASRYFAIGGFASGGGGSPHMLSVVVHSKTVALACRTRRPIL